MAEELPIKYVKDKDGRFLPVTSTKAVVTENGKNIDETLEEMTSRLPTIAERNFLEEEYEKTLNLINDKSVYSGCYGNNATLSISGNELSMKTTAENYAGMWFNPELFVDFENGKTYTFSFSVKGSGITSLRVRYENNASDLTPTISSSYQTITMTFTKTTTGNFSIYAMNGSGGTLTIKDLMWVEGTTALPYQEYNGAIVHKKDVDGILLWKNGNANNQFGATTLNLGTLNLYKKIQIYYLTYTYEGIAISTYSTQYNGNNGHQLNCIASSATKMVARGFSINTNVNTITFKDSYVEGSVDNHFLVPYRIYGLK